MARIRSIKPEFFTDHKIAQLSFSARLTFIGLWTYADDEGRGLDEPRLIKAAVWPLDDKQTPKKVDADLAELERNGRIRRYAVDGERYLQIVHWGHQRIDKPRDSSMPPPGPIQDASTNDPGPVDEASGASRAPAEGKGKDLGKEGVGIGEESALAVPPHPRPDIDGLCNLLAQLIEANGSKPPSITAGWRTAARLLLDNDRRDPGEAEKVIRFSQADQFWRPNILSMPKLREKYDTLRLQMTAPPRPRGNGKPSSLEAVRIAVDMLNSNMPTTLTRELEQ